MKVPRSLPLLTALALLCLTCTVPGLAQEAATPAAAQPNASAPPAAAATASASATAAPAAPDIAWENDPELRWIEAVPIFVWWAGEDQPRVQVCTEDDVTGATVAQCPIDGAPESVKSLHVQCVGFDCHALELQKRVRLFGKVVEGLFVAGKHEEKEQADGGSQK